MVLSFNIIKRLSICQYLSMHRKARCRIHTNSATSGDKFAIVTTHGFHMSHVLNWLLGHLLSITTIAWNMLLSRQVLSYGDFCQLRKRLEHCNTWICNYLDTANRRLAILPRPHPGQNGRHFADEISNTFSWMKSFFHFDSNFTGMFSQRSNWQ